MSALSLPSKALLVITLGVIFPQVGRNAVMAAPATQAGAATVPPAPERGPAVGQKIPAFTARDQFGKEQKLSTLAGPNGLVLLFVRSADW